MKKEVQDINDIDPYKVDKLSKVPSWLIVLILKYWAAAAAIYFIGMDTFVINWSETDNIKLADDVDVMLYDISQALILVILFGLFLALFSNYIVRPFVRMMYNRRNNTYRYNMINVKGFKSFLLALLYNMPLSFVIAIVVIWMGNHGWVPDPFGTTGGAGVEPFSYALVYIVIDAFCVLIKNIIVNLYERAKYKRQMRSE